MENYLEGLNAEQLDAVKTTEGYVRVIACAGSGKTKALTSRYAYIVDTLGISPSNILCVTFTNKAAFEMKRRVQKILSDKETSLICTFHGFCVQVIKRNSEKIYYPQNFSIIDNTDKKEILKKIYTEKNIGSNIRKIKDSIEDIEKKKKGIQYIDFLISKDDINLLKQIEEEKDIDKKIFLCYLYEEKKNFSLDFDDLINVALFILNTDMETKTYWQNKLEYIMVDEFQDVSDRQYGLCSLLSEKNKNLFVVGDPDQTIYSWRGANINYILDFDKHFSNVKTIYMEKNYRSIPEILNVANCLIEKNSFRLKKRIEATKKSGEMVFYNHFSNTNSEGDWIAKEIKKTNNSGINFSNFAILYRSHFVSRAIEEGLRRENIPYIIYSGTSFYERKEIKDIVSYLKMLTVGDDLSFERTVNEPSRKIGKKRIEQIKQYAKQYNISEYNAFIEFCKNETDFVKGTKAKEYIELIETNKANLDKHQLSDIVKKIIVQSGYESMLKSSGDNDALDNLAEFFHSITDIEKENPDGTIDLNEYLAQISLYTNIDKDKKKNDCVKLMTIHSAKGMEFPYVFMCGMNEGIFPSSKANTKEKLEEERRLAYVGYTRAENVLILTDAEGINDDCSFRYPSRFILQIKKEIIKYNVELSDEILKSANESITANEKEIYNIKDNIIGLKVNHPVFGNGIIKEKDSESDSYVVIFTNEIKKTMSRDKIFDILI